MDIWMALTSISSLCPKLFNILPNRCDLRTQDKVVAKNGDEDEARFIENLSRVSINHYEYT